MQTPAQIPLTGLANTLPGSFDTARIFVPDEPAKDDIGAASAVSARLGATLTGMLLPPVAKSSQVDLAPDKRPLILIGLNQPRMPAALQKRVGALKDNQGLVAWADGAIVIAGPTPLGTRIAAEAFAGRAPYLWDLPGKDTNTAFDRVAGDVSAVLKTAGLEVRSLSFDEIVFEKGRDKALSALITAAIAKGTIQKARAAAKQGLAGRDTLHYSGVEVLVIRLADGTATETISIS